MKTMDSTYQSSESPEKSKTVNPTRLALARRRNKLTKKRLAELVGKSVRTITAWESEEFGIAESALANLAKALGFSPDFLLAEDIEPLQQDAVSFRSLKKMTAGRRDAAIAAGTLGLLLSAWIDERFGLPDPDLPDMGAMDPEAAAVALRQCWKLGELPISNMVHLLESRGVRVFSLAEDCTDVDAFSFWHESRPYVFLNTMKTSERSRFDAGHELGHLILHQHGNPTGQTAEREADTFASTLLMPASQLRSISGFTIRNLIPIKKVWRVSLKALVYRLNRLGLLSEWTHRSLCMEIQSRYGNTEPEGLHRERSQVLEKVFQSLWSEGITKKDVSQETGIPYREIEALTFGLVSDGVDNPLRKGERLKLVR